MIVRCEACGENYQIDPSKIKSDSIKTRCRACGHVIIVHKPEAQSTESSPGPQPARQESAAQPPGGPEAGEEEPGAEAAYSEPETKKRGISLRAKIFILFFFIPIILFAGAGYFYLIEMNKLSGLMTEGTSEGMTELAQRAITNKAESVAAQVQYYLEGHPNLIKQNFNSNQEFKSIAVQKVGETGYTALHDTPENEDGPFINWAHVNPEQVGMDLRTLKDNLPDFWNVLKEGRNGEVSSGYYEWKDADGKIRDKFMVCAPVEGTSYYVAATTYLDEFTQPVDQMEAKVSQISSNFRNIVLLIVIGTIVLLGIIVSFYGTVLIRRLRKLTTVAERISVGEMDAEVPITSKDETGDLAEAIQRMQDSIRLSIERLRRRRRR